ncbi:hypothetical protein FRB94_006789 [Tulasnella sp. JGI-2019a]|nr:hypothetical protein FRB93_010398 [Tulasnella sp. JGI-2019a]KAG9011989.1 hypothetical protein FRB94_006789 [Tulasnella sp. JGI-2019a]
MFIARPSHPEPTAGRQVNPSEVGWQFVLQYYTLVNKQPNRIYCFYTKNSTFINGTEGEDAEACYGQHEIRQKILSLNYHDCKVFIHSVDAQSSTNNGIIIQVIGEMSNHGEPWKKFVQTSFLAEQPKGYFVLNDIFRFLKEDTARDEGEEDETIYDEAVTAPGLVEPITTVAEPLIPTVGAATHTVKAPTPVPAAAAAAAPTASAALPAPPGPKTWATLAASNNRKWANQIATEAKGVSAAAPQSPATSLAPSGPKTWATLAASNNQKRGNQIATEAKGVSATAPLSPTTSPAPAGPKTWATLAASNARKWGGQVATEERGLGAAAPQTLVPTTAPPRFATNRKATAKGLTDIASQCFVMDVTENVKTVLREALINRFGQELEIVRSNGCAFLEFASPEAAQKAIQSSFPVSQGDEGGIRREGNGWSEWVTTQGDR